MRLNYPEVRKIILTGIKDINAIKPVLEKFKKKLANH